MKRIHTVVIGGGQAGLAMSRCLSDRDVDHVVLERGRVAERWRSERWDSLRLLTPNWQTRLPRFQYDGPDPDGFMGMRELVAFLERYATSFEAPVETGTTVLSVTCADREYRVLTDRDMWLAQNVVIATGYNDVPYVPSFAKGLSRDVFQVVPTTYRNPQLLPAGGVLVVGASSTGIQLAEEINASGRPVTLAVGRHLRLPRTYRGRDILWWLEAMGVFKETVDGVFDIRASRNQPSLQLVGRRQPVSLDISYLRRQGVQLVGPVREVDGSRIQCDTEDIIASAVASDVKLAQLLTRIDAFIASQGLPEEANEPLPFEPTWPAAWPSGTDSRGASLNELDLAAAGIRTVVWATGFRRQYPWLHIPILDAHGDIRHREGVTPLPGLFVLGMHFQRRRNSAFIDGVGDDARMLADRIVCRSAYDLAAARRVQEGSSSWPAISMN